MDNRYRRTGKRYIPVGGDDNNRVGIIVRALAYLVLIIGIVAGVVIAVNNSDSGFGGFTAFLIVLLSSMISFIMLLGFSEIIFLQQKKQTQHYEELEIKTEKLSVKKPDNND